MAISSSTRRDSLVSSCGLTVSSTVVARTACSNGSIISCARHGAYVRWHNLTPDGLQTLLSSTGQGDVYIGNENAKADSFRRFMISSLRNRYHNWSPFYCIYSYPCPITALGLFRCPKHRRVLFKRSQRSSIFSLIFSSNAILVPTILKLLVLFLSSLPKVLLQFHRRLFKTDRISTSTMASV